MSDDEFRGLTDDERQCLRRASQPTGVLQEATEDQIKALESLLEAQRIRAEIQYHPEHGPFMSPRSTELGRKALRVDALVGEEFRA
jgi:hypothetical protein